MSSSLGLFAAGRLSSRRIRSARRLLHQSSSHANDAGRSGFSASASLPTGGDNKLRASIVAVGALSCALAGATLYLKRDTKRPKSEDWGLRDKDAATLEEVIAEEQDLVKEAAMKARFEERMVKYERWYESEEEKTMRYREFKRHFKNAEKANMINGKPAYGPNGLSDLTKEECYRRSRGERYPTFAEKLRRRLGCDGVYKCAVEWWILRGK